MQKKFYWPGAGARRHGGIHQIVRTMRLTAFFLTAAFVHVYASGMSQQVTISGDKLTLKQVFSAIEQQTGFAIFSNREILTSKQTVSLSARQVPLQPFLEMLFNGLPLKYDIQDKTIFISPKSSPPLAGNQQRQPADSLANFLLKGRITDSAGIPLPEASVTVKGKSKGSKSDPDGSFVIHVTEGDVLQVSSVGFETRSIIITAASNNLVITLQPAVTRLDEVAVTINTGYQKLPKERATGSFDVIDRPTLNQQVGRDVLSRLEGVASGLIVDRGASAAPSIKIRGLSTIAGPKDVLVVVDNFPYEGNIDNINPNDVENITILKDAAAASIWGARAGNGVIVITMKKGARNQPLKVDLNMNYRIGGKPDLSKVQELTGSSAFIDLEKFLYEKGHYKNDLVNLNRPVISPVVDLLHKREMALPQRQEEIDRMIDAYRQIDVRDEYMKYMYRPAFSQQYALSLSGGAQNMAWISSVGYDRERSNLAAAASRLNLNFQNTFYLAKNLELTSGLYYTQSNTANGKPGFGELKSKNNFILPYTPFANEAGKPVKMVKGHNLNYLDTAGNGKLLDWSYYPLEDYKHEKLRTNVFDATMNAGLRYSFLNSFSLDVKYLYQRQHTEQYNYYDEQSFNARNTVNTWTQIRPDGTINYAVPKGGLLDESNTVMTSNNIRGQLNYNGQWNRHTLSAIAGGEVRMIKSSSVRKRFYGYNEDVLTFGSVDHNTTYPMYVSGGYNYILRNDGISARKTNFISGFANAAYTYNEKYTLSLSARQDASNLFGLNTNDQWNPFWSAGVKWDVSREQFFRSNVIGALQLRATYGFSGNVNPAMVAITTLSYFSTLRPETNSEQARFNNYFNPELQWETSKMLNIGADFTFWGRRVTGSLEYYRKKGENLFAPDLLDYTGGIGTSITRNVASLIGQGVDLSLKTVNLQTGNFEWRTIFQYSHNTDRVLHYYLTDRRGSLFVGSVSRVAGLIGKPVHSVFAYKWAGLDPQNGDPMGYVDGSPSKAYSTISGAGTTIEDLRYFGSALPTHFGSLVNMLSWKGLSLSFNLVYKLGYYFRKESISYSTLFSNWRGHVDYANRWQQPGDEQYTDVPSMVYPAVSNRDQFYAGSEVLVGKADHIRLQYVNLAYELPKTRLKGSLSKLRTPQVYVNATNLGLLWKANKFGVDPDRMALYQVPEPLVIAFGLRAGF